MKILPRRILKMSTISTQPNNTYGFVIEATDTKKSVTLLGTKLKESVDETILKDLVDKYAYASALLYFVENFNIDNSINKNDLLEDINVLLHSRCRVIKEKAPELTKIGNYPLYEGTNYILRGDGELKIKESFNLNEDIEMKNITADYLNKAKFDDIIKGFVVCPKCKNVYEEDSLKTNYPDIPDDYSGPTDDEPLGYECPYCGFESENEETFSDAWLDDLKDAPNIGEYIDKPITEDMGTQASDIASKVDYSFQSSPTPANPGKKKKYESIEIKELDESTYLNLTGFIKDVDGLYKRGDYIIVRESDTGKITAIHKSKLNEEIDVADESAGPEKITEYLKSKLDQKFPGRFEIKSSPVDDAFGLVITDNNNHEAGDLIDVTDAINAIMKNLEYNSKDYEIDYKKNNLIMAIYNPKQIYKSDIQNKI